MMGRQSGNQDRLFYSFRLDEYVPKDHLLRGIDKFLDLSELRTHLESFYSHTGRPSVDPELMIRMLVVGYCMGIRSERRLCEEVQLNLAYRWFCRLDLEDKIPDHSTFSKNRHGRFRQSETFRHLFETVLGRCILEGLVGGEGFAVDASVIKADANHDRSAPFEQVKHWRTKEDSSRPVREYLDALDACNPCEADEGNANVDGRASPAVDPKIVSTTDPAARYTASRAGPAFFAYSTNYLIDLDSAIILDVQATPAHRSQELQATKTMVQRVQERFDIKPRKLVGDTAYGIASMLNWMVNEKGIEPHVPIFDRTQRQDGTLSSSEFQWSEQANEYRCPQGKVLQLNRRAFKNPRTHITQKDTIIYRASQHDCAACPRKVQCCPSTPARKITRSIHEGARDVARSIAQTEAFIQSRRQRKKVEMLFAHLKRILKLDRLRLRGPCGAQDEFLLAATAQNLRRMAQWLTTGSEKAKAMAV